MNEDEIADAERYMEQRVADQRLWSEVLPKLVAEARANVGLRENARDVILDKSLGLEAAQRSLVFEGEQAERLRVENAKLRKLAENSVRIVLAIRKLVSGA